MPPCDTPKKAIHGPFVNMKLSCFLVAFLKLSFPSWCQQNFTANYHKNNFKFGLFLALWIFYKHSKSKLESESHSPILRIFRTLRD